jgi:hypothetical protein
MATWSEWFKNADKDDIPLSEFLIINQPKDIERLYSSGLPVCDRLLVACKEYLNDSVVKFCEKHNGVWIRVYNKTERHYKLGLKGHAQVKEYIESLDIDVSKFKIQIFEFDPNKFGGNIVSGEKGVYIEMVYGDQLDVANCWKEFCHGYISPLGILKFHETDVTDEMKRTAFNVLKCLKTSKGNYMKGYFEFVVSVKNNIYFLDYKVNLK